MQIRAAFVSIAIAAFCLVAIEAAVPVSYVTYDQAKHEYEFCSECGYSPAAIAWGRLRIVVMAQCNLCFRDV